MMKLFIPIFILAASFNASALSLNFDFEQAALEALLDNASEVSVLGDQPGDKLSTVLAKQVYPSSFMQVSITNTCEVEGKSDVVGCRLVLSSASEGEESAVFFTYLVKVNKETGKVELANKTVMSMIAG